MASIGISSSNLGSSLSELLIADDIQPGDEPGYQLCKTIYLFHPLGKKLADTPISLAQSKPREISVPAGPELVREKFLEEFASLGAEGHVFGLASSSRTYGVSSIAMLAQKPGADEQVPLHEAIDPFDLPNYELSFNLLDPLNTAGSLVGDLNPLSMRFLKFAAIAIMGKPVHRSRAIIKLNEQPIYLSYTGAAFGYSGRSVYQRALYPLKSFVKTMVADEMVATKAGVIIAKLKSVGSIVSELMQRAMGLKRNVVKEATTWNVISIDPAESIESLNLQNVNGAMEVSRRNILHNTAVAADMPAILVNSETYANGFGEGTQDAHAVANYIGTVRAELDPAYAWFDQIAMYRAWTPDFYETIQNEFPEEYGNKPYKTAFMEWKNSFKAQWPPLITEPESEAVKVADTKLKAAIALVQVLAPMLDPANQGILIEWCQDNFNELEQLFQAPLELDMDALADFQTQMENERQSQLSQLEEPPPPKPFSGQDAASLTSATLRTRSSVRAI